MRVLKIILVLLLAFAMAVPQAEAARKKRARAAVDGTQSPRYAALIMNPVTGEVYHNAAADARRYPASLTKMMTLYLLFEALERRNVSLDTRMNVSEYAANMPQTNLALDAGDTIPVEVAIKALVVRSANDVSVVVAEALAGDVERFADVMTAKARQLGMRGTVFKNPNGLPNPDQYTTARDMAKLGIALKRDFPSYYRYFNTRQFSWNGVTYYTHNRVMLRYTGTDGIKTGYIGASGFNLVSSVTRGGRPLVGVVLGGISGRWRDDRMITLLDNSYKQIAERGGVRGKIYTANLPLPRTGGNIGLGVSSTAIAAAEREVSASGDDSALLASAEAEEDGSSGVGDFTPSADPVASLPKPAAHEPIAAVASGEVMTPEPSPAVASRPSPFALARVEDAPPKIDAKYAWGIQVGAFSSQALADQALGQAQRTASEALKAARPAVAPPVAGGAPIFRGRFENLSQIQAQKACSALISNNSPCFIFKVEAAASPASVHGG